MPTSTWIALANYTVTGSADSEVVFASIPNTYRDLVIVLNGDGTSGAIYGQLRFNSDSGNNYNRIQMYNTPANGVATDAVANENYFYSWNVGNSVSTTILNIMDYSATDKHKTILTTSATDENMAMTAAGRWASTNAITSISLSLATGNFDVGSTFALYGIVS